MLKERELEGHMIFGANLVGDGVIVFNVSNTKILFLS